MITSTVQEWGELDHTQPESQETATFCLHAAQILL